MKMLIVLLFMVILTTPVMAQQKLFGNGVGIYPDCVVMPVGKILLISRDDFVGAIKFLHNEERADGIYSKYDYLEYEKDHFRKVKEEEFSFKPFNGKGIFFHGSPYKLGTLVKLRNFGLFTVAGSKDHSTVYFWSKPNRADKRVRLAPTPWKKVEEIDLSDPRIRWFRHDKDRGRMVLPIDKIWD